MSNQITSIAINDSLITSLPQLRQICDLMEWANLSDSDEVHDRPSAYASQRGLFGHLCDCMYEILFREGRINRGNMDGLINWGGNNSFYDDVLDAIKRLREEQKLRS